MSVSPDDARFVVMNQYPGSFTWKDKVRKMSDKQVVAIYYSMLDSGKLNERRKVKPEKRSVKPISTIHTEKEKLPKPYEFDIYDEAEQLKLF